MKRLQCQIEVFSEKYNLDSSRCSEELWNFSMHVYINQVIVLTWMRKMTKKIQLTDNFSLSFSAALCVIPIITY